MTIEDHHGSWALDGRRADQFYLEVISAGGECLLVGQGE